VTTKFRLITIGRARAAMRGLGDMVLAALTQTAQYSVVSTSDRASSVPRPLPSNYVKTEPALGPPVKSVKVVKPPVKTTDPSGPLLPPYPSNKSVPLPACTTK
jgi:hypothetical protein